jgi:hypothetical protein
MDLKRKVLAALIIVLFVTAFAPGLDAKTRRGASVIVTGTDGGRIEGELIAVKPNSLLLMTADGKDQSVDIGSIASVKVKKRSKVLLSMLIGTAAGIAVGGLLGAIDANGSLLDPLDTVLEMSAMGAVGLVGGGVAGLIISAPKTVMMRDVSGQELEMKLAQLRKYARVRDFQ